MARRCHGARTTLICSFVYAGDFLKETSLRNKFNDAEWSYYLKLIQTKPTQYTSSIGRLFDAIAAMLNLCDHNTFEGEAAMLLETHARKGKCLSHYSVSWTQHSFDAALLVRQILTDLDQHVPTERIAYKFHVWLVDVIYHVALRNKFKHVALSGGVVQNALLIDLIEEKMNDTSNIYLNKELSANDENISLGQLACVSVKRRHEQQEFALNYHYKKILCASLYQENSSPSPASLTKPFGLVKFRLEES